MRNRTMVLEALSIALIILGMALFFEGVHTASEDFGSCPLNATRCYHTFPGTDVYITPLGRSYEFAGLIVLGAGLGAFGSLVVWKQWQRLKAEDTKKIPARADKPLSGMKTTLVEYNI